MSSAPASTVMKMHPAARRPSSRASRCSRFVKATLCAVLASGFSIDSLPAQTSAVPLYLSYQGRVTNSTGTAVGSGSAVNRKVTFRIWDSPNAALNANLIYSETQNATISEGEFSVLIGQGSAVTGSPLGYDEAPKGPTTRKISDPIVFGAAARYLGVTVDDGTEAYHIEISPRQQIVTSAFAFRAKYAESVGANGANTITAIDNGNVGIGTTSPSVKLDVVGGIKATGAGGYGFNSGDADGGIFSPADNTITFFTNAAERMRLVGDNLGIGTTTPLTRLDVNGAIAATAAGGHVFGAGDVDSGMFSPGDNNVTFKTGGTERVRFASNGHVGIGTASPVFQLEIRSAVAHGAEMAIGDLSGTKGALYLGNTAHGLKRNYNNVANDVGLFTTNGSLHLSAAGAATGQFALTQGGDIGIGTSAPTTRLHVAGGSTSFHVSPGMLNGTAHATATTLDMPGTGTISVWDNFAVSGSVGIGNAAPTAKLDVTGGVKVTGGGGYGFSSGDADGGIFSPADGTMTFWTNNAEKMRLDPSGNLGLGTAGPMSAKLDVNGNIAAAAGFVFGHGDVDTGMYPTGPDGNTIVFQTANVERVRFTSNGRVGIGTNNPSTPLHVSNNVSHTNTLLAYMDNVTVTTNDTNSTQPYSITADSRIRTSSGFDVVSDARIKHVLGRSSGEKDLDTLMKVEVTDYRFKDTVAKRGRAEKKVIAQQLEQVFPAAVNQSTDVIPDIFQNASINVDGWVALATNLKVGERVRIMTATDQQVHEVLAVEPTRFRTALKTATASAFIYGREVSDFRNVDYDAIAMLNVSATQEIKRTTETELSSLRAENATLRAQLLEQNRRLAAIEQRLGASNTAMARPAALPANGQD